MSRIKIDSIEPVSATYPAVAFVVILWPIFSQFDLFDRLVGYWATLMIFVAIWEFCLPFNFDLLNKKGAYYCENKCSFFSEKDKSIWDIFTPKMYMELYTINNSDSNYSCLNNKTLTYFFVI